MRTVLVPRDELAATFSDLITILTCDVRDPRVETKVIELFPAALATELQEEGFSDTAGTTAAEVSDPVSVEITLTSVPAGLTVTANEVRHVNDTLDLKLVSDDEVDSDGSLITFVYDVLASDTSSIDESDDLSEDGDPLDFTIEATTGNTIGLLGAPVEITMTISLGTEDDDDDLGTIPRFLNNNIVDEAVVALVTDCQTRLLYSWVVNIAGFETGIAIANTSEDDAAYGPLSAVAQDGLCVLTGYPAAGGTPISFTTAEIPAGQTLAFTISGVTGFADFSGYVLAVCNFLNAHSFAFITDGFGSATGATLAQGYQALVVETGVRIDSDGESVGH